MNIAIMIPTLSGGGAERVAQILGNYYVERGNKIYYFIADADIKQDYLVKGKIIQTNIKSCMSGVFNDTQRMIKLFCSSLKIRRLKRQYEIDVAISFMEEFNYLNVLSKGKEKVITRVCTILSPREELKGFLYKKEVVRFFYSNADKVIIMSQYALKDMYCHYGVPLKKLIKIPNPSTDLKEQENNSSWSFGTKAVVCVGRLEPIKQQERIIRAFSCVCKIEPDARLVLLGKGYQRNFLEHLCEKLEIRDRVIFVGFTDNVSFYLQHSRVFVMASKVEGFPNSMVEAMYYGVPVITTDSPGACGEIVGKPKSMGSVRSVMYCKYGILTPHMPCEKLKINSRLSEEEILMGNAMIKVLTENEVYEKYRSRSYKRAKMFGMDKIISMWDSVLEI